MKEHDDPPKSPKRTIIGQKSDDIPALHAGSDEKTVMAKGTNSALAKGTHDGAEPKAKESSRKTIIRPAPAPDAAPSVASKTAVIRKPDPVAPSPQDKTMAGVADVPSSAVLDAAVSAAEAAEPSTADGEPADSPANTVPDLPQGSLPQIGARIDHYEIVRELGAGGMGTVYIARDTKLGRRVAIKFLQTSHPELTQRFLIEARATARCSHENIVVIHEVGEFNGSPFMVLEFLKGQPLNELTEGGQRFPAARAVELMVPVVRALVCAHEQGIVHRDLKPDNIFITNSGTIKVLDFGIAKVLQSDGASAPVQTSGAVVLPSADDDVTGGNTNLTRSGTIMGTMKFMSPEQWGIGIEIDHRTDIWAMGILLYQLMAGQHPLHPLEGHQLLVTAMLDQPMPKLREACPDVPPGLADIVDRCLLKEKEERYATADRLLKALEAFLPGRFTRELRIDETPYAGLSAFQEGDADRFFGRSGEIAAMVTRIRDQPMMAVVGSSGVGKSSFVRAGVLPGLKQSGEPWKSIVIRPGRYPLAALASVLSPMVGSSASVADDVSEQEELVRRLYHEPGYLGTVMRSHARKAGEKILIFVDQFEELYTLISDHRERTAFTTCLTALADDATSPLRVVLSIRSDFLDRVPEDQYFMAELAQGLFFLTPPNRDGLRDALVQPAEMAGFTFESGDIVEQMLDHLETTPGALPLLQFAASKLWETRDAGRKLLTKHSYQELGGIAGALASHADSVVSDLAPQTQTLARAVLLALITPERTRAIVSVRELKELSRESGEIQSLVDHLVQARLLVVQTSDDPSVGSSVEIVHESLIHSWPMLKRWLDDNQDDAVFLDQLRTAANQWQAKSRDSGLLWRGETMEEAKLWFRRYRGELPKLHQEFLNAVFSLAARGLRRRRFAAVGTIVFLLALIFVGAIALLQIRDAKGKAEKNAVAATSAEKVAQTEKAAAVEAEKLAKSAQKRAEEAKEAAVVAEKAAKDNLNAFIAARDRAERTGKELGMTKADLIVALKDAEGAKKRAEKERALAESSEKEAVAAKLEALSAKSEVEKLLRKETKRVEDLEAKIGQMINELN